MYFKPEDAFVDMLELRLSNSMEGGSEPINFKLCQQPVVSISFVYRFISCKIVPKGQN